MKFTRTPIDNSLACKRAEEFFKDWTFENITLGVDMEDEQESTVHLHVSTNTVGSENDCDMGYTITEWKNFTMEEQNQIINEFMANVSDVWVQGSNGENVD